MNWLLSSFLIAHGSIGLELIETENSTHLLVLESQDVVGLIEDEEILSVQEFDFDGSEDDISQDLDPAQEDKLKALNIQTP